MRILSKFFVLTWKNFVLKKKHWVATTFEILVPVVLFALLAILRLVLNLIDISSYLIFLGLKLKLYLVVEMTQLMEPNITNIRIWFLILMLQRRDYAIKMLHSYTLDQLGT